MKKILFNIILLSFSVVSWGQLPQTNLDLRWTSGYTDVGGKYYGIDSLTGVYSIDIEFTKCSPAQLSNITAGYVSAKDSTEIVIYQTDTIPITCLFWNYNYQDTLYFEMLEHTINSDSTENLPYRLASIAHYSTPTDARGYFSGIEITGTMIQVSTTIAAAITAASTGDTIATPTGDYTENSGSGALVISKNLKLIALGNVKLASTGATYNTIITASGAEIIGYQIKDNSTYGLTINYVQCKINNCTFSQNSTLILRSGTGTEFNNCVFIGSGTNELFDFITTSPYSYTINESFIEDSYASNAAISKSIANDTSKLTVTYNNFSLKNTSTSLVITSGDLDFNYNTIYADTTNTRLISQLITSTDKTFNIKYNNFYLNKPGQSSALVNSTHNNYVFNVDNNYLITTGGGGQNFLFVKSTDLLNDFYVTNNYFDVHNGGAIYFDSLLSGSICEIKNNRFLSHEALSDGEWFVIRLTNMPNDVELIIEKNEIKAPLYYGSEFGGHGALHIDVGKNAKIRYNNIQGGGVGSLTYKGRGVNNDDAVISYNIVDVCAIKGQRKVLIHNNNFINSPQHALDILENQDVPAAHDTLKKADSCRVYNNIFYGNDTALMIHNENGLAANTMSNNNIFYNNTTDVYYNGVNHTLEWWQTNFNQDLNSYETDPNFKSSTQLWPVSPSNAIGKGVNLGDAYKTGLDITTSWPDNIVTKNQLGLWSIGAYVVPLQRAATSNSKIILFNNKYLMQ